MPLPSVSILTVVDDGAVHVHQIEAPPNESRSFSSASKVASTVDPEVTTVAFDPRERRLAKASFAGGAASRGLSAPKSRVVAISDFMFEWIMLVFRILFRPETNAVEFGMRKGCQGDVRMPLDPGG